MKSDVIKPKQTIKLPQEKQLKGALGKLSRQTDSSAGVIHASLVTFSTRSFRGFLVL